MPTTKAQIVQYLSSTKFVMAQRTGNTARFLLDDGEIVVGKIIQVTRDDVTYLNQLTYEARCIPQSSVVDFHREPLLMISEIAEYLRTKKANPAFCVPKEDTPCN
jgi:hypothetical protein